MSVVTFLLYFIKNQWAVPSTLGFTVVLGALFMTAYNHYNIKKVVQ